MFILGCRGVFEDEPKEQRFGAGQACLSVYEQCAVVNVVSWRDVDISRFQKSLQLEIWSGPGLELELELTSLT